MLTHVYLVYCCWTHSSDSTRSQNSTCSGWYMLCRAKVRAGGRRGGRVSYWKYYELSRVDRGTALNYSLEVLPLGASFRQLLWCSLCGTLLH